MAKIRNPSSTSNGSSSQKRSSDSASPGPTAKRRKESTVHDDTLNLSSNFSRENSPGKSVHWGRGSRIISGPTASDPELRRSQSPTRPALRRPTHELKEEERGIDVGEDEHHGPSAQLQDDLRQAPGDSISQASRSPKKSYDPKSRAPGVGNVYKKPTAGGKANNTATKPPGRLALTPSMRGRFFTASESNKYDEDICERVDGLVESIKQFALAFPARPESPQSDMLTQLLQRHNEQLVRYIGSLALSDESGEECWQQLLTDNHDRMILVWAVVGKALKEHVFDELYFGAWPELETKLQEIEKVQARQDGFYRHRARADEIARQVASCSASEGLGCFYKAVARVTLGIEAMLLPLWCLGVRANESTWTISKMRPALFRIVGVASKLAQTMRTAHEVIYYWPSTIKDEEFEPVRMECVNIEDMIQSSPYETQEIDGRDRPLLREGHDHERQAIVRVVVFPGIQAFRQGGGELAKRQLAAERHGAALDNTPPDVLQMRRRMTEKYGGGAYTGYEGVRTKIITKSVVLLKWGRQRLLTQEAGTSAHLNAVENGEIDRYTEDADGCVELFDLFLRRTGTTKSAQRKSPQRSPSIIGRIARGLGYNMEEEVDEEPEVATSDRARESIEATE